MIESEEELRIVRERLATAERALAALRERVKNERNFAIYSEGPLDQIADLKAEIQAYEKAKKKHPKANGKSGKGRQRRAS
jgi:hypothetical protein